MNSLGDFILHLLFAKFYTNYYKTKLKIIMNCKNNINKTKFISCFKKYELLENNKNHWLNNIFYLQKQLQTIGINKVINISDVTIIRKNILSKLPLTKINTSNIITVHFENNDILNIHSSKYFNILQHLCKKYTDYKIIIFTHKYVLSDFDDLATFKKFDIYSDEINLLEMWRIFVEAPIIVMSKSTLSYSAALLRTSNQKTYYANFWHPYLDHWIHWFPEMD